MQGAAAHEDRPTVLAIGRGEAMLDAIALALDRHGVQLELGDPENAVQSVFVQAPDLVLLVGDASVEEGVTLEKLAATVATAVVPVAILADDASLDHRMQAARFGAVAIVPRSASADAMAMRIAEVARELPERKSSGPTDLGEASLDEVVELFARRLRSGILAVSTGGTSERVVLRGDRPVTQAIEELVDRLRPLVTQSDTVRWEFQQAQTGQLAELTLDDDGPSGELDVAALFRDRRIVIVEKSPARADDLVVALRQRGAHVVVIDGEGTGLAKARAIDPDVILVDVSGVGGWAGQAMQLIRADARLRWAALLVTRGEELWKANTPEPDIARLAAGMLPLVEPDESLTQRVKETKAPIDVRLETTGPTRLLRAVARSGATVHATVRHRRATIEIDFAQGLVVGARGEVSGDTPGTSTKVEGGAALAVWLGLGSGRVRIEPREAPSVANVMSPVDDAIAAADRETPVILPSIPPPAGPASISPKAASSTLSSPPSGQTDARALVTQLETLLDRLRHTLPPGTLEVPSETAAALAAVKAGATPSEKKEKDATPTAAAAPMPPPGARLPAPPASPKLRKATQMGMPVPQIARPPAPAVPAKRLAPAPAPPAVIPSEPPPDEAPPAPPPRIEPPPPAPPAPPAVVAMPAAIVAPPIAKHPVDDEAPTSKRPALAEAEPPRTSAPQGGLTDLAALLEPESFPPGAPPAASMPVTITGAATEPGLVSPPSAPLEATDQIRLPPPRPEDLDEPAAIPGTRSRGGTWIVLGGVVLIALLGVGAAAAWRMGLFAPGAPVAVPLLPTTALATTVPPATVAAPPPTTSALATTVPPTTAVSPPATDAVPPATTDVPPGTDVAPPPTTEAAPPPTDVAPPPTTTLEVAPPPTTTEVAPPPTTTVEEDDEPDEDEPEDDHADAPPRPDDPQFLVDRANFRRTHGDLPGAEADYLHVLRVSPNNARAQAGLARLHLARHDARTASTWARRLAEGHTANAGNYVLLGDTLQATGDTAGARRAWERALEITPGYRDARRRLGR